MYFYPVKGYNICLASFIHPTNRKQTMNKGIIICLSVLLIVLSFASCKRKHDCYCRFSGSADAVLTREYRGYSKKEAKKLCESEENAASGSLMVDCEIR